MAIRFSCPACRQPIEIDDEWASSQVGCPYCQKTVLAPALSEPFSSPNIPRGRPAAGTSTMPTPGEAAYGPVQKTGTWTGMLAILLSISTVIVYLIGNAVLISSVMPEGASDPAEFQQAMHDLQEQWMDQMNQGQMPKELGSMLVLLAGIFALWVGGVICGILSLKRPLCRNKGIIALVISAAIPLLMIVGFIGYLS